MQWQNYNLVLPLHRHLIKTFLQKNWRGVWLNKFLRNNLFSSKKVPSLVRMTVVFQYRCPPVVMSSTQKCDVIITHKPCLGRTGKSWLWRTSTPSVSAVTGELCVRTDICWYLTRVLRALNQNCAWSALGLPDLCIQMVYTETGTVISIQVHKNVKI
jgi:hypothetical protein